MRILVTGGTGFIGSNYVRNLLQGAYGGYEDAKVTVVDRLTHVGNLRNLDPVAASPRLEFVHGDITDATLVGSLVKGCDAVINFAAETHVDRSIVRPAGFVTSNVIGVQVLLQACLEAGVGPVVQVSTSEVYGSVSSGSWTEQSPVRPSSPYAAAKAGGDLIAQAYARTYGLDVRVTRSCNSYGPYQNPEKIIPRFITNLLNGVPVPLYGDGDHVRNWIHVDDHCRGIHLVLERGQPGQAYHIGGSAEISNLELTKELLKCCGADWEMVLRVPDRKGHVQRCSLDDSILRAMGYLPQIPFSQGLETTVEWYKASRAWWEPLKSQATSAKHQP